MNIIFTKHAEQRLEERGIFREEVIEAIKYPNNAVKKHEKYCFQKTFARGTIEVLCVKESNNNIKVVTMYWR